MSIFPSILLHIFLQFLYRWEGCLDRNSLESDNAEEPSVSCHVYAQIKYSENLSQIQETSTEYTFTWPYFITPHFKAVTIMSVLSLSDSTLSKSIIYGGC